MIKKVLFLFVLILVLITCQVYATTLDGNFNDWDDLPSIIDVSGDAPAHTDLTYASWFPDLETDRFYMMIKRNSSKVTGKKWYAYVDIQSENKVFYVDVEVKPSNNKTSVKVFDEDYQLIYSASGYWTNGYQVEFYIPLHLLVDSGNSGYSFDMVIYTDDDMMPDNGVITVSTISTYPIFTLVFSFSLIVFVHYFKWRRSTNGFSFKLLDICSRTLRLFKT